MSLTALNRQEVCSISFICSYHCFYRVISCAHTLTTERKTCVSFVQCGLDTEERLLCPLSTINYNTVYSYGTAGRPRSCFKPCPKELLCRPIYLIKIDFQFQFESNCLLFCCCCCYFSPISITACAVPLRLWLRNSYITEESSCEVMMRRRRRRRMMMWPFSCLLILSISYLKPKETLRVSVASNIGD